MVCACVCVCVLIGSRKISGGSGLRGGCWEMSVSPVSPRQGRYTEQQSRTHSWPRPISKHTTTILSLHFRALTPFPLSLTDACSLFSPSLTSRSCFFDLCYQKHARKYFNVPCHRTEQTNGLSNNIEKKADFKKYLLC